MGVWIEIVDCGINGYDHQNVTPCVGVWIEIILDNAKSYKMASLPAWECGLKYERIDRG